MCIVPNLHNLYLYSPTLTSDLTRLTSDPQVMFTCMWVGVWEPLFYPTHLVFWILRMTRWV